MMLFKLLKGMDGNRFDSSVISLMGEGTIGKRIKALGVPVFSLDMSRGKFPGHKTFLTLFRLIRKIKPAVLQGWMYHGNLVAFLAGLLFCRKAKIYWNIRQSLYDIYFEKKMTRLIIRLCAWLSFRVDSIVYNSMTGLKQHTRHGYHSKKAVFIPNGFDISVFKPCNKLNQRLSNQFGLLDEERIIGLIARYHLVKDHETFLKAASLIISKVKNVRFVMVGTGVDWDNNFLKELIKSYGLDGKIILLGEQNNIKKIMCCLDILVSSSYAEAFSNVIGEAMACGVPCVVTDVGDSALIVKNTGMVVPPGNARSMASSVIKVLNFSKMEQEKMGNRARQRIIENFSIHKIIKQYENLYERT